MINSHFNEDESMKLLKNMIAFFVLCTFFVFLGCSKSDENGSAYADSRVVTAVEILWDYWNNKYEEYGIDDKHLEIINTRIINIKENDDELFRNVDYIVEFTLLSNYYDTSPYYSNACVYDSVVVYDNGDTRVSGNLFNYYRARTYENNFSNIIESIEDFEAHYNQILKIK